MNDRLNEQIKQSAENHEIMIDPMEIWAGIEEKMEKPKRRRMIWWLFPGILSLGLLTWFLIPKNQISTSDSNAAYSAVETNTKKSNVEKTNTGIETVIINPTKNNEQLGQEDIKQTEVINKVNNPQSLNTTTTIATLGKTVHRNQSIGLHKRDVTTNEKSSSSSFAKVYPSVTTSVKLNELNNVSTESKKEESSKALIINESDLGVLSLLPLAKAELLKLRKRSWDFNYSTKSNLVDRFNSKRNHFDHGSIKFYAGLGFWSQGFSGINVGFEEYINERSTTEQSLELINLGFSKGLYQYKSWEFFSGLDYTRANSEFKFDGTYMISENGSFVDTIRISAAGDSTITFATGSINSIVERDMIIYNAYQSLDVPIGLRYHFNVRQHQFFAQGELLFNVYHQTSGYGINKEGIPVLMESELNLKPKLKSYRFGFAYAYEWDSNFSLYSQIDYRINQLTDKLLDIRQNQYGIKIGLSYRFK